MDIFLPIFEADRNLSATASGLFKLGGSHNTAMWEQKLGLEIESRNHPTRTSPGAQENSLWFRFLGELIYRWWPLK